MIFTAATLGVGMGEGLDCDFGEVLGIGRMMGERLMAVRGNFFLWGGGREGKV